MLRNKTIETFHQQIKQPIFPIPIYIPMLHMYGQCTVLCTFYSHVIGYMGNRKIFESLSTQILHKQSPTCIMRIKIKILFKNTYRILDITRYRRITTIYNSIVYCTQCCIIKLWRYSSTGAEPETADVT